MAVTKDEILDSISKMTVMEVVELIADMEKKFGVTAAAPVAAAAAGAGAAAAPAAEELTHVREDRRFQRPRHLPGHRDR